MALVAGAGQAAALAPTPHASWQIVSMALFLALLPDVDRAGGTRRVALTATAFGFAWLAGSFWWLFVSLHRYGHLPAWMAAGAVGLLAAALSSVVVAAALAWSRWRTGRLLVDASLWAALWLLSELARGQWFTGFPWGAVGYAHVDGPLALLAPWLGVYGVGAVAAGLSAALSAAVLTLWPVVRTRFSRAAGAGPVSAGRRPWLAGLICAAGVALSMAPVWRGPDFTRPTGSLSVTLLQGNVPQDEKFDWQRLPEALGWHVQTLMAARTDLVVAPETAIPLLPDQLPQGLWQALTAHFDQGGTHALIGLPLGNFEQGYTNSVAGLAPGQPVYRYDKHHLVPFGEFIPPGFRWFVKLMQIPLGDFARGPLAAPAFQVKGERVAPNICYEDLFGEELAARFVDAAQAPTVLANVSNIGWFGQTVAVDQHLQISRMRSLELQRPMLRATNTGATVAIDHRGRVTHALAPHRRGVLQAQVEGRSGNTPYADWVGRLGLMPLWLLALAWVGLLAWRARGSGFPGGRT
nr:apolipoprotein N-acyltransferase [Leptothrix cholodnii]